MGISRFSGMGSSGPCPGVAFYPPNSRNPGEETTRELMHVSRVRRGGRGRGKKSAFPTYPDGAPDAKVPNKLKAVIAAVALLSTVLCSIVMMG